MEPTPVIFPDDLMAFNKGKRYVQKRSDFDLHVHTVEALN